MRPIQNWSEFLANSISSTADTMECTKADVMENGSSGIVKISTIKVFNKKYKYR